MEKDVFQQLVSDLQNYKSVIRVVTDWRNGGITASLAMEQINYILIDFDDDNPDIDETETGD